jgi:hypothetical protein
MGFFTTIRTAKSPTAGKNSKSSFVLSDSSSEESFLSDIVEAKQKPKTPSKKKKKKKSSQHQKRSIPDGTFYIADVALSKSTEPTTSHSDSEQETTSRNPPPSSPPAPTLFTKINSDLGNVRNARSHKIGSAVSRTRSNKSMSLPRSRSGMSVTGAAIMSRTRSSSKSILEVQLPKSGKSKKKSPITAEIDSDEEAVCHRFKLGNDMIILAEGMHLDANTKALLAKYDAKTIDDFFMMGDVDFNDLLAKARTSNRGLPPLQIRKVRILREWVTELVKSADPSDLPWAKFKNKDGKDPTAKSLVPKDWKRRFKQDLPTLKKKLREKVRSSRKDSFRASSTR